MVDEYGLFFYFLSWTTLTLGGVILLKSVIRRFHKIGAVFSLLCNLCVESVIAVSGGSDPPSIEVKDYIQW